MKKQLSQNPTSQADPVAAHELLLYGNNHADLYRQREVPIQQNLTRKWQKGTYDHAKAVTLWGYWAADAAQRYPKEHGTGGGYGIFTAATRRLTAKEKADEWLSEMDIQHPRRNPSAYWHAQRKREADHYDRAAKSDRLKEFFHGKSVAHLESELSERAHANPFQRVKVIASHAGYARWLQEGTAHGFIARPYMPVHTPYSSGPSVAVFLWRGQPHVIAETSHRRYEVWKLDAAIPIHRTQTEALNEFKRLQRAEHPEQNSTRHRSRGNPCTSHVRRSAKQSRKIKTMMEQERRRYGERTAVYTALKKSLAKVQENPIAVYGLGKLAAGGLGNPPAQIQANVAGVVYSRITEIKAEKTHRKKGFYRHPFGKGSQILALDNGDLLVHSTSGKKLWKPD